jgi:hypothetical protein
MTITCSGDINCGELSQGCSAMCGEAPIVITGSGGLETESASETSKAEADTVALEKMTWTAAEQAVTIASKGGDQSKMQQYLAEAKAASDRAQTIAAKHPNDSRVQHAASIAKQSSDLGQEIVAREMKRRAIMEEILRAQ